MSAVADNKWSRSSRPTSQHLSSDRSGASTPSQSSQQQPPQKSQPPVRNAWTDRSQNAAKAKDSLKLKGSVPGSTTVSPVPLTVSPEEKYVPANNFNASEITRLMEQNFNQAVAGDAQNASAYVPQSGKRGGDVWSQKRLMANKQDFWTQLAKQVAAKKAERGG